MENFGGDLELKRLSKIVAILYLQLLFRSTGRSLENNKVFRSPKVSNEPTELQYCEKAGNL